jgi:hypothetical protein
VVAPRKVFRRFQIHQWGEITKVANSPLTNLALEYHTDTLSHFATNKIGETNDLYESFNCCVGVTSLKHVFLYGPTFVVVPRKVFKRFQMHQWGETTKVGN